MSADWRELPPDQLESVYNPRMAVGDPEPMLRDFAQRSAQARRTIASQYHVQEDLRYGAGELTTLDFYHPGHPGQAGPVPLAMFIHGGYWRGLDKSDHSFVAEPLLAAGSAVANVNYDLCPAISLDTMVEQVVTAVRYCQDNAQSWRVDPARIILIGHSAGAHLAARVLNQPADAQGLPAKCVSGVVAISGIYEPEVVLQLSVNEQAQIDLASAERNNCLNHEPLVGAQDDTQVAIWAGGDEPAGWIDQSTRYAQTVRAAKIRCENHVVPGTNHFTVLTRSVQPDSPEFDIVRQLLGLNR